MTVGGQNIVEIFVNWFPMLALIGVWIYFLRRMRSGPFTKYQKECYDLARRQAEALERIATMLEKKG
jgi:flagellar biogenesis protein FliO